MKAKIVAAVLGLGMVVGSLVGGGQVDAAPKGGAASSTVRNYACDCETKVTTSRLNLRSGPGTNYEVMLIMDEGAEVQAAMSPDLHQNGFVKVKYGDNFGWAAEDYLADPGSGGEGGWNPGDAEIVGVGFVETRVNFRTGPGTSYSVQFVLDGGDQIALTDIVQNGFRYVWHAGYDGWVCDLCITEDDGTPPASLPNAETIGTATTTDRVNFRVGPGMDYSIREVLAAGTEVEITDIVQNGFRHVSIDGTMGWISDDYLA